MFDVELFGHIDGRRGAGLHDGAAGHRGVRVRLMQSVLCWVVGVVGELACTHGRRNNTHTHICI